MNLKKLKEEIKVRISGKTFSEENTFEDYLDKVIDRVAEETYKEIVPEDSDYYCNGQTKCPVLDEIKSNFNKYKKGKNE